jgi:predicted ATPase
MSYQGVATTITTPIVQTANVTIHKVNTATIRSFQRNKQNVAFNLTNVLTTMLNNINDRHPTRGIRFSSESQQLYPTGLVIDSLRQAVEKGELLYDAAQEKAAMRLSKLQKALMGYSNRPLLDYWNRTEQQFVQQKHHEKNENDTVLRRDDSIAAAADAEMEDPPNFQVPRGLFLHGHVGTGKTRLMDMFYHTSPIPAWNKKRVHFHSFMQDVHRRIHALKQQDLKENGRNFTIDTRLDRNPIRRVAKQLAEETALLCFDEFQVTDVADALILSQLFDELFRRGTVMVATSNRHPKTLYEGGLNRGYFLPFIDLLCKHCIVHDMNHDVDYRIVTTCGITSFFYEIMTNDGNGIKAYHEAIRQICSNIQDDLQQRNVVMNVPYNRTLNVPFMSRNEVMARFHFNDLCKVELGSSDYRAMAQKFKIVILDEIPVLTLKEHDEARRFITLIDELYEAKCVLMCSAVTSPDKLFVGRGQYEEKGDLPFVLEEQDGFQEEGISVEAGETFGMDVAQSNGMTVGELASVQELSFAFRRAASRMREMTSKSWWEKNMGWIDCWSPTETR